jgi:hypothetical protein
MLNLPPVTLGMAFIRASLEACLDTYAAWHAESPVPTFKGPPVPLEEPITSMLMRLEPFSPIAHRELFVATRGEWTAYFNSGIRGTDAPSLGYLAQRMATESLNLYLCDIPALGVWVGVTFTLYGPRPTEWQNVVRHVGWLKDGDRQTFSERGAPLPFEQVATYKARRVRDRLTKSQALGYAEALGVRPLDEAFYSSQGALIVGPIQDHMPRWSFSEWRKEFLKA